MKDKIKLPEIQDFFDAVKDIRTQGIAVDTGDGVEQFVMVDIPSIASDIGCEPDDSLESVLYPAYEEIVKRGPGYELYAEAYEFFADKFSEDRKKGGDAPDDAVLPWFTLRNALEDFVRDFVVDGMVKRHAELRDARRTNLAFGLDGKNRVLN